MVGIRTPKEVRHKLRAFAHTPKDKVHRLPLIRMLKDKVQTLLDTVLILKEFLL
nr:MAG TPA_asm: hypothetical protein [Bacteriophage sp.]